MASNSCGRKGLWNGLVLTGIIGVMSLAGGMARADQDFSTVTPTDFSYSVAWLKSGPARQRMEYAFLRNRMLKTGFEKVSADGLKSARQDYEAARKLCSDDPRLDYAFGLVLWTHGQTEAAIPQFETAARLNGASVPFVPAIQAAAFGCLVTGHDERGMKLLLTLAKVISSTAADSLTLPQKQNAALSLGRAIGYLEGPGRSDQRDPATLQTAMQVVATLPAHLKQQFDLGKAQVTERQQELKALAARSADDLQSEFESIRSQIAVELANRIQSRRQTSEELAKAHGSHRKTYFEFTSMINSLAPQMAQVINGAAMTNQALADLRVPRERIGVRDVGPTQYIHDSKGKKDDKYTAVHTPVLQSYVMPESFSDRQVRLGQLNMAMQEMRQIEEQANRLRKQAEEFDAKRKASATQYSQAAASHRRDLNEKRVEQSVLSQQLKNAERSHRSLVVLRNNANSILGYVLWDANSQREALIKSYVLSTK